MTHRIVLDPAYLRIIGLGPRAIPLILDDLRENGGWWFVALRALTGENPAGPEDTGHHDALAASWLLWAEQRTRPDRR